MTDEFGGVLIEQAATDEFGGIAILDPPKDEFGGVLAESSNEPFLLGGYPVQTKESLPRDGMERAVQDFQIKQKSGMVGQEGEGSNVLEPIGKGLGTAGKFTRATTDAIASGLVGDPEGQVEAFTSVVSDEPNPADKVIEQMPLFARLISRGGATLIESTPRVAGVALAQAAGVPAPVSAAALFGVTDEGEFDPKSAALAAALPFVGKYGGEIAAKITQRWGIKGEEARQLIKIIGNQSAANAYLGVVQASEIANMPEEERKEAWINAIADNLAQSSVALFGAERGPTRQVAETLSKSVKETQLPDRAIKVGERATESDATQLLKTAEKPIEVKSESLEPSPSAMGITPSAVFSADAPSKIKGFLQKNFTSEGNLPKEVYDKWQQSRQDISSETKLIDYNVRDLYSALRKNHNISLSRFATKGMADVPPDSIQHINRVLVGEADPSTLPENVRVPVEKMREHIDSLSQKLIDKGLIDENLKEIVGENLGNYLTRSYRIFDNPEYAKNIPVGILNNARSFILSEMRSRNPSAAPEMAETKLREMIADWSESGLDKQFKGGKLGSKDLTQFMKRQDLAPEIRAVLGEYESPVINYARSVTKIARFVNDQQFLNQVREMGMGKFLFEEGQSPEGFSAKIAADESSSMSPLNGLRTSPEIKESFENFNRSKPIDNIFLKTWLGLTAVSKTAKTVGSLLTQARNLIGQPYFNLMSGHWDVTQYGKAVKAISSDVGVTKDAKWQDYYRKLTSLGLVNESAPANELRASLKDAGLKDRSYADDPLTGIPRVLKKGFIDAPTRAYQISDEIGKIVGFENELARMKRAYPDRDLASLEREAAERVRNTYPTYSKVPEGIKQFRKQPVFGPFVTFASEAFRTVYNSLRYAKQDLSSSNPEVRKSGASRLIGITAALGLPAVVSSISRGMSGIKKEEEDDVRRFLPDWSKNSQMLFLGREDGVVDYVNLSYQNPYSFLADAVIAATNDDERGMEERLVDSFKEFLRPFASEQMIAAAMMDISRNKTQNGREVYNPQDDPSKIFEDKLSHLLGSITPGTIERLNKKIIPSLSDSQPDYGRKLDPTVEIGAELTGIRREKLDFNQALQFKMKQFREEEQDAEYIFSGSVARTGTISDDNLIQKYKDSNESRFNLWKKLYGDYQAAKRNGVPESEADSMLSDSGLSSSDRAFLKEGIYSPTMSSERSVKSVMEKASRFNRVLPTEGIFNAQREFIGRSLK